MQEKVVKRILDPQLYAAAAALHMTRGLKKAATSAEEAARTEFDRLVEAYRDEFQCDELVVGALGVAVEEATLTWTKRKGSTSLVREKLLSNGVDPEVLAASSKTGKGSETVDVELFPQPVETII